MPVAFGGPYLSKAVESVLRQTMEDWELVVVLQGPSIDDDRVIARYSDPRIHVIRVPGLPGLASALNLGLDACSGQFIARLDADDVAEPDRLRTQYDILAARPNVVVLGSAATLIDKTGEVVGVRNPPIGVEKVRRRLLWSNCIIHPTVMIRLEAIKAVGAYNTHLNRSEDHDLWLRLSTIGDLDNLSQRLIQLRQHSAQLSRGYKFGFDSLSVIKESRKRAAGDAPAARILGVVQHAAYTTNRVRHRAIRYIQNRFPSPW